MTLRPLGDRVLVKPAPKEERTSTGLYISSGAQEKPQRGEVVAVGEGKRDDNGNRIVGTFQGTLLNAYDQKYE
jgi:chaperonin GroES